MAITTQADTIVTALGSSYDNAVLVSPISMNSGMIKMTGTGQARAKFVETKDSQAPVAPTGNTDGVPFDALCPLPFSYAAGIYGVYLWCDAGSVGASQAALVQKKA